VHHRRPMLAAIAAAALALTSVACTGPDDDSGPATTVPPGADQDGDDATEGVTGEGAPDDMDGQLPDDDPTGRTETTVDARPTPQEDTDRGDEG
jgi:hypothetical protein